MIAASTLTFLRRQNERARFARLRKDDASTRISADSAKSLARALTKSIEGEVRFDKATRALYATDGSNYRQVPIGVVIPRHADDVVTTVRLAREYRAPVLARGGGTSLAGQCCNVAVVIDFSKYMHSVVRIDAEQRLGHVQPGCVLDHFRETAKRESGLFFGPDPSTHNHCTLGGMLGNNSCGSHSLLSKNHGLGVRTSDNTHALEVLLYDGTRLHAGPTSAAQLEEIICGGGRKAEIYAALKSLVDRYGNLIRERYPKLERRVSGYNLDDLLPEKGFNVARALVGSESTLVTILEATMHLVPAPKARSVAMLGFKDIFTAVDCALDVLRFKPIACEGIDKLLFEYVKKKGDQSASVAALPQGPAFLLVEFGGDSKKDCDDQARQMIDAVKRLGNRAPVDTKLYDDPLHEEMIWKVREGGLGSTAWVPGQPDAWAGWEDSAVPVEAVPSYLRKLHELFSKYHYRPSLYGHMGQGCVHCRVQFDLYTAHGIENYRRFMNEAVELVVSCGGVASGEHGDGQARGQFLRQMFGSELMQAFRDFKRIWDPVNRMNPGKVIDLDGPAYGLTDNLRIGPDYSPPQPATHFSFNSDRHSFARGALRCVGVGECRRQGGGTMCPSYMVTREEKHSTRGRARMLFEMLNGEIIDDGWRSGAVKDALDLCLSCKGCKGECPVNVDMATYKAEFLSHYYKRRIRPRSAYAFGWIPVWSQLASFMPSIANIATHAPGFGAIAKLVSGAHPSRALPYFAPRTFIQWFRSHPPRHPEGSPVVLFADTFNNYFHSDVAIAATEVLEDAGFRVHVPAAHMCCGRTLYDYGFLRAARRWSIDLLSTLRPYYRAGVPMVVLEPSCWSVFQDELCNLLSNDEDAKRLKDLTFTLSDFLAAKAPDYSPPQLGMKAVVHGHCHQKALDTLSDKEFGKLSAERRLFEKIGIEARYPEDGCCGMAGAFGYEKRNGHYQVGLAVGERILLPEVRKAGTEDLIVADGFSCQEQIHQQTDRTAMHTAQVLQLALHTNQQRMPGRPESEMVCQRTRRQRRAMTRTAVFLGVAAILGIMALRNSPRA